MNVFKHYFLSFVCFMLACSAVNAQYANSWINHSQQYFKIKVAQDGMYRLDYDALALAGVPVSSVNGNTFRLYNRGESVPVYVSTASVFSNTDYLEFFGMKNDGSSEKAVYNNPVHQANDKLSLFNDTAAYFLTWASAVNPDIIVDYNNVIAPGQTPEPFCWFTSTVVYGGARAAANLIRGQPEIQGQQVWDSDFSNAEGYIDNTFNFTTVTRNVSTPHPFTAGPAARLKAQWCGKFPTQHYMEVRIGTTVLDIQEYFGFNTRRLDTLLPTNALLGNPTTGVVFSSANNPNTNVDHNGISNIEITYPRQFNFANGSLLRFTLPAATGSRYIAVTNFNAAASQAVLYDMTNKLRLSAVAGGLDTLKFLLPPATGERHLVMVANAPSVIAVINNAKPVSFVNFNNPANRGDFVIIANKLFFDDGNGNNYVDEYRQLKNSHGHQAVIIEVQQMYDQFGYGIDLSPLCFRNFTDYALAEWNTPGEMFMLLVGKGIEYHPFNETPSLKQFCLVPTWGYPGSDILLTAQPNNPVPRIHIGRLSILAHQELKNYKDKVEQYVAAQNMPQTIADKAWMKRVIHLAGGENANDQFVFQYILNQYASMVEDSVYFGGDATLFAKNSSDPISMAVSAKMDSLISGGVSLITFFGHSSYQSLDFNLNNPYNYQNTDGKYPLILTNGCLVGNLFAMGPGLGGEFTFAQNRGSIGFLAPSSFSVSNSLQLYTDNFYRAFTKQHYNKTIGELITHTVDEAVNFSGNNVDRMVAEQMLYNGDPSLRLHTFAKPDYAIETPSVFFNPANVTAGVDSFAINVIVTNIGKAIDDSIMIDITRVWPNGDQSVAVHQKVKAPYYIDTFTYKLHNPVMSGLGLNQFVIKIDSDNDVDELSEMNNQLGATLVVQSDDIIPVYPYNFSIVNQQSVVLKASTVDPFVQQGRYVFQLDTTELFNSPFLKTTTIIQNGGVVSWQPPMTMSDSTVYYWRTSVDTVGGKQYSWHKSSFVYIAGSSTGWNQSHYFQFLDNRYVNIELGADREFKFVDDIKTVAVYNGVTTGFGGPLNWDEIGFYINGTRLAKWTCGNTVNWLFAVIDPVTGIHWESYPQGNGYGQFFNIHCNNAANYNAFYFNTSSAANHQVLINFIDSIPEGHYVLAMSINNPGYAGFTPALEAAFQSLGAQAIDTMTVLRPYVLFSKKGDPTYPLAEIVGDTLTSIIDVSFDIIGSWETGFMVSEQVGPAQSWQSLHWKLEGMEPLDEKRIQVIGVQPNGTQQTLLANVNATDTSLAGIDAAQYPYLKLRVDLTDTLNRTAPQLDYWRINYSPEGELAIDPHSLFVKTDTVNKFSNLELSFAVANVSPVPMYNVPVKYVITDATNAQHVLTAMFDTVPALDTIHASLSHTLSSAAFAGLNKLLIEINPFGPTHVNEQYHFNNIALVTFIGTQDVVNPYLDVTFDGIRIMNRDIVSARPEIVVRLKDDNQTLKLTDTSAFDIKLRWPDGTLHNVSFDGVTAIFTPASGTGNTASATFKPVLTQDGTYQLIVQGYDRSGNAAGQYAYRVDFDVFNKPMISNVLNYPNPFTTQTRFVFTLTGSRIPEYFKIQIMTVTGKIVKEIHRHELGPLHIGHNITEYAWDGTDQFGDKLANGLYLYRVVTRLDNNPIDRYETSVDKLFHKGFGKMYLMR